MSSGVMLECADGAGGSRFWSEITAYGVANCG